MSGVTETAVARQQQRRIPVQPVGDSAHGTEHPLDAIATSLAGD